MVKSVEGIYRNGKVELLEPIFEAEGLPVTVTWSDDQIFPDRELVGSGRAEAADLRHRLRTFAEDWERPEMDAYDKLP